MKLLLQDVILYVLGLLTRILSPSLQTLLARFCMLLVADVPRLGTTWVVHFREPSRTGNSNGNAIDASLQQFGRYVAGKGHCQGKPGDVFEYRGFIKRNVFYGSFRRVDSHVLAGTGTFVLKISPDSRQLSGRCSWYDNILDDVWSTKYNWSRHERR